MCPRDAPFGSPHDRLTIMHYDVFEHRHRFARWAAARAAQRGFATTETIVDALDATRIRDFVSDPK